MNNVLLDPLPTEWEGEDGRMYKLDTNFQIGIQICILNDDPEWTEMEKNNMVCELLFSDNIPDSREEREECIEWFLNGWNHDKFKDKNNKKKKNRLIDFDVDQWRIYSAFRKQYGINLNESNMHWWEFMGLLTNLDECAYTRVIDIRNKDIKEKMSKSERKAIIEAKKIYGLDNITTLEEQIKEAENEARNQEALAEFNKLRKR